MDRLKIQPQKVLRFISIGFLAAVLIMIAVNFVMRSKRQVRIPSALEQIEGKKIDRKEKIEIIEFEKEKGSFMGKADKHYIGENNLYHLEGNVEIAFFERSEGEDILLSGQEIVHDKDLTYFWLQGQATVQIRDLTVLSSVIEYDAGKQVFKTDQGVQFFSKNLSGSADRCVYLLALKKAELRGDIAIELLPNLDSPLPIQIKTNYFEFYVGKGKGQAEGAVELVHGESFASAGLLKFELVASREQIKFLYLKENINITLQDEFKKNQPFSDHSAFALYGDKCEIQAEEIFIKGFRDLPQVQSLEADGACLFKFLSKSGSYTQIKGKHIDFTLSQNGRLKNLSARKEVSIFEEDVEKKRSRRINGEVLNVQGNKEVMSVEGGKNTKTQIRSQDSEITAKHINYSLRKNDLEAEGDVQVVLYARKETGRAVGFFSEELPVFIKTNTLRYFEKQERFLFNGMVKLWQTKENMESQMLTLNVQSGAIQAGGGVRSVLSYYSERRQEEEKIEIAAENLGYHPRKNCITYKKDISLKVKDMALKAQILQVFFDKENGDISRIAAKNEVVVVQNEYEGRGGQAQFEVKKEIVFLLGNPVLIDKNRGQTEGSKLTFYMADDRIVIENKDRERSETVIKS
jgi:lipopolysaccharide transport protein LptA